MRHQDRQWQFSAYSPRGSFPPGCKWLMIINAAVFVPYYLAAGTSFEGFFRLFALVPEAVVEHFAIWQLVTFLFLHGGVWHLIFNMVGLWAFGPSLEWDWGTKRFLKFYFTCGVGSGLCIVLLGLFGSGYGVRTIGASGAILGLITAFALLYPNVEVLFMFMVNIKVKYLAMMYGAISLLGAIKESGDGTSHIGHLGGMIFGFLWVKSRAGLFDLSQIRNQYNAFRIRRAKKKFQVYMRKHGNDPGDWVN